MGNLKEDSRLDYSGMRFRTSRQTMGNGESWIALRRLWDHVPQLDQIGLHPNLLEPLRTLGLRQGLILLGGATGAGKTTTATAILVEYLRRYGQLALTIEDPIEYDLHGVHGKTGFCYQREVEEDEEWASALKTALRWHPRYILVGEIRTPPAAKQLLRAATSGHLVITTIHSGSLEETVYAAIQMAHPELGELSHNLVADGLVAVIHQTMTNDGPKVTFCTTRDQAGGLGDPIRACIRDQKIGMITTFVEQQASRLGVSGGGAFLPEKALKRLKEASEQAEKAKRRR